MKRPGIGIALFILTMLTAVLVGVMYFSSSWLGTSFAPADLYAWLDQFNIKTLSSLSVMLSDILIAGGADPEQAGQASVSILSIALFYAVTLIIGLTFYALAGRRGRKPDYIDGLTASVVLAAPMIFFSLTAGSSDLPELINGVWQALLFLGWGAGLSYSLGRTMIPHSPGPVPAVGKPLTDLNQVDPKQAELLGPPPPIDEASLAPDTSLAISDAAKIDRRQFLLRFGASTAALATGSVVAGRALANQPDEAQTSRPSMPVADPELLAAQPEMLGNFRRFAILRPNETGMNESQVLALGTEYPDRHYVSVWIGDRSPIVIYESLESVLAAFGSGEQPATAYWLDS
jgi:hypothetical protein